jgi:MYXO-CTERM domain-containing protein
MIKTALVMSIIGLGSLPAFADSATVSGAGLNGLAFSGDPGDAQYVAGTPDVFQLYTPDAGLNGDAPGVKVKAANVGFSSLGTLNNFSANYDLFGTPTPDGFEPYFLTYLYAPGGGYIGVISDGGPDLDGSSGIHVIYDFADTPLSSDTYSGDTLSQLDSTTYGTTTFGQLPVYETIVEIGDWNISDSISANADIESITVASAPDAASTLPLLAIGFGALAGLRRRLNRA